ncbi:MAG TPA: hypothetical protein PKL11_09340, partial [Anaerolineaceae bacterium]|nr:hypothetical protein [Anaerolineaceae bacterium]
MKQNIKLWIVLASAGLLLGLALIFWPDGQPRLAEGARPVEIWLAAEDTPQTLMSAAGTPIELLTEAG